MIPDSLRKARRADELLMKRYNQKLTSMEEDELSILVKEADIRVNQAIARLHYQIRSREAHNQKSRSVSIGNYATAT